MTNKTVQNVFRTMNLSQIMIIMETIVLITIVITTIVIMTMLTTVMTNAMIIT
jgi:hypothetical protein